MAAKDAENEALKRAADVERRGAADATARELDAQKKLAAAETRAPPLALTGDGLLDCPLGWRPLRCDGDASFKSNADPTAPVFLPEYDASGAEDGDTPERGCAVMIMAGGSRKGKCPSPCSTWTPSSTQSLESSRQKPHGSLFRASVVHLQIAARTPRSALYLPSLPPPPRRLRDLIQTQSLAAYLSMVDTTVRRKHPTRTFFSEDSHMAAAVKSRSLGNGSSSSRRPSLHHPLRDPIRWRFQRLRRSRHRPPRRMHPAQTCTYSAATDPAPPTVAFATIFGAWTWRLCTGQTRAVWRCPRAEEGRGCGCLVCVFVWHRSRVCPRRLRG